MKEPRPRTKSNTPDKPAGFTLIELLIVIAVLGILATIAVPVYLGQRTKAARTEGIAGLESIRLLEEAYFAERGCYYVDANNTCPPGTVTLGNAAAIRGVLRGFNPGGDVNNVNDRLFLYSITYTNDATQYTATATGRAGTTVDGTVLTINQDNVKNY